MGLSGLPTEPVTVPAAVAEALGAHPELVWRNELGGLTFRSGELYAKWSPPGAPSLAAEAARLAWARPRHPVPDVAEYRAFDDGELLVTWALPGDGAVTAAWIDRPHDAVRAIGEGLRALHELPVAECMFTWSLADRLRGRVIPRLHEPPADRLVVCHGDACAPNTVIGADGRWVGHVDLGSLGVADRWADLAVASMSLAWNYGEGWEAEFFAAYGIAPDEERIRYYRAVWNAEDEPAESGST